MEPTFLPGRARPLLRRRGNPPETHPGGESGRDTGRRRPRTLTTAAAVPRLFLSRPGSLSVFSFGPTSGAQRCLIVRDSKPAVPPPGRSAAHAGNARCARRAARRPAPPPPRPRPAPPASAAAVARTLRGSGAESGGGTQLCSASPRPRKARGGAGEQASGSPRQARSPGAGGSALPLAALLAS